MKKKPHVNSLGIGTAVINTQKILYLSSYLSLSLARASALSLSQQVLVFRSLMLRGNGRTLLLRDKGCS